MEIGTPLKLPAIEQYKEMAAKGIYTRDDHYTEDRGHPVLETKFLPMTIVTPAQPTFF